MLMRDLTFLITINNTMGYAVHVLSITSIIKTRETPWINLDCFSAIYYHNEKKKTFFLSPALYILKLGMLKEIKKNLTKKTTFGKFMI